MPSEKLKYMRNMKHPIFDTRDITIHLRQFSIEDLAHTLALAGEWDPVVFRINQLKVGFKVYGSGNITKLKEVIDYAVDIDAIERIQCSFGICQIVSVAHDCVKAMYKRDCRSTAVELARYILDKASQPIGPMDGEDYWYMTVSDLTDWVEDNAMATDRV